MGCGISSHSHSHSLHVTAPLDIAPTAATAAPATVPAVTAVPATTAPLGTAPTAATAPTATRAPSCTWTTTTTPARTRSLTGTLTGTLGVTPRKWIMHYSIAIRCVARELILVIALASQGGWLEYRHSRGPSPRTPVHGGPRACRRARGAVEGRSL